MFCDACGSEMDLIDEFTWQDESRAYHEETWGCNICGQLTVDQYDYELDNDEVNNGRV